MNHILCLHTISPDILHSRRPDLTGDTGKILQPRKVVGESKLHEVGPFGPGLSDDETFLIILVISPDIGHSIMKHQSVEIRKEKEVAASADMEHLIIKILLRAADLQQFPFGPVFSKPACAHRYAECRERRYILILFYLEGSRSHRHICILFSHSHEIIIF